MATLLDFQQRSFDEDIVVGEQALKLSVPAVGPTNEVLALVFDDALLDELVKAGPKIVEAYGDAEAMAGENEGKMSAQHGITLALKHADSAFALLKSVALPFVRDKAFAIAIICLDSLENRKRLAADEEWVREFGEPKKTEDTPGIQNAVHSPVMRRWLSQVLGPDQAMLVMVEARCLIQWGAMGEALGALFRSTIKSAISAPTAEPNGTSQTTSPSTPPSEASSLPT